MYFAVGTLMTFVMIFGVTENFAILYTYLTNRNIRTTDNVFIVGIALSDIGQSVLGIPFVVIASFSKRWIFGFGLCQYYAFITTFLGISQVAMLTMLAIERYNIIVRCQRMLSNSYKRCLATISFSFLYGIGWATGPLIGWSSYEEETQGIACSVSWELTDPRSLSYTISLFTFGWFIPLTVISFGYLNIAWTVSTLQLFIFRMNCYFCIVYILVCCSPEIDIYLKEGLFQFQAMITFEKLKPFGAKQQYTTSSK